MSVRAYKINKIDFEQKETFNLWHCDSIREWLIGNGCYETMNDDGCGIMDVSRAHIQEVLKDKKEQESLGFDKEDIKILKQMLKDCGENDYVQYYCF